MSETSTLPGLESGATTRTARPQFFALRGPLAPDRAGYIERAADRAVWQALEATHYVNLTGAPKSGKTSLMLRLARRLRELDDAPTVAMIELRQLLEREGRDDVARCFYAIAFRLARQLRVGFDLQDWWADNAMLPHHLRFLELFREFVVGNPGRRLVLLFDDSGDLARREEGEPFLQAIRLAYDSRTTDPDMARLCVVFGSTGDAQFGVADSIRMPHSVSQRITLEPFNLGESFRLAPALGLSRDVAEFAMQRIFDWVAGQPSMTQTFAASLASRGAQPAEVTNQIDQMAERMLAKPVTPGSDDYVGVVAERVLSAPRTEREAMLVSLGQISKLGRLLFDARSAAHDQLLALGLAKLSPDGFMVPGSRIIRRRFGAAWANQHLAVRLRGAALAVAATLVLSLVSVWYLNRLPADSVRTLTSAQATVSEIGAAYERLAFWPGHSTNAERLLEFAISQRFAAGVSTEEAATLLEVAEGYGVPVDRRQQWLRQVWKDRRLAALRRGDRLAALRATRRELELAPDDQSLLQRAVNLVGSDFPDVRQVLSSGESVDAIRFDARENRLVSSHSGTLRFWQRDRTGQWLTTPSELRPVGLQSAPLNLRFELPEVVRPARLKALLEIQHPRPADLQLTITAPNGVSASLPYEALPDGEWSLSVFEEFRALRAATPAGLWSMTIVDSVPDMTGEVVAARLGSVNFGDTSERGLSDPVPSTTADILLGPDGRFALVFPDAEGDLAASWELKTRRIVAALPIMSRSDVIGFTDSGTELIARVAGRVERLRLSDGAVFELPDGVATASRLWHSKTGRFLAAVAADPSVLQVVEIMTGETEARLTTSGSLEQVAISDDASLVATVEQDRIVRVWSTRGENIVAQVPVDSGVAQIAFAADQLLILPESGGLVSWSLERPEIPSRWAGEPVWSSTHDRQTGLTLIGSARDGFRLHDLVERSDRALPFLGLSGLPLRADLLRLRDGLAVISEPESGTIVIWEPSLPALSVGGFRIRRAWLSNDNALLAVADARDAFTAVRLDEDIEALRVLDDVVAPVTHSSSPAIVEFSPDQKLVLSVERAGWFRLHDVEQVLTRRDIGRAPEPARAAAFDATGTEFAISAGNRLLRFDAETGEQIASLELDTPANVVAWSGTLNSWLIGDQNGSLIAIPSGSDVRARPVSLSDQGPIDRLATGLNNDRVAVARDHLLSVIDLNTRQQVGAALAMPSRIDGIAAAEDGRHVLARAGQWLFRVHINSVGLRIRSQRLISPGALPHSALVPTNNTGSMVTVLDGLDEPVPRSISMDYSDIVIDADALTRLERVWRALGDE
ncbi:MAG: AAA-like domain-containing protein [Pseudomonadota bacterium]